MSMTKTVNGLAHYPCRGLRIGSRSVENATGIGTREGLYARNTVSRMSETFMRWHSCFRLPLSSLTLVGVFPAMLSRWHLPSNHHLLDSNVFGKRSTKSHRFVKTGETSFINHMRLGVCDLGEFKLRRIDLTSMGGSNFNCMAVGTCKYNESIMCQMAYNETVATICHELHVVPVEQSIFQYQRTPRNKHLPNTAAKRSLKAVKAALETLATGSSSYDTAYDEAFERIEGQLEDQSALAKDALSWIVCSKRPLQIVELQEALAVEQGMTELDTENRPEIEDVISACAGLLTIDEYSRVVRLVHYTTQEYFQRNKTNRLPGAEALVAAACVSYLSFDVFDAGQCEYQSELRDRIQDHPLYHYASVNWGYHVRESHHVQEEVMCFLEDQERLRASAQYVATEVFSLVSKGNRSEQIHSLQGSLHRTCRWRKLEINAQNPEGETPLFVAVSKNFVDLTRDLLESHGAEVSKYTHGQTLLSVAVQMGHYDIVRYFVCCQLGQFDINKPDMHGPTPLLYAIAKNNQDIISLLLDVDGVAYNQRGPGGKTPLLLAVGLGQDFTVKILLERDEVEADSKDNEGRTPLSHAASNGDLSILGRLLETDRVEVDSRDDAGRSPLSYAAGKGDLEIVRCLLRTGKVDADSRDRDGRTPLFYVAMASNKEAVRYFLETKRVDVNTLDVFHQSILLGMWPSYRLWEGPQFRTAETHAALMDTTELLIELGGADPNVRDNRGRTLLWKALFHGHVELAEYLVKTGRIDGPSNFKDIAGRTPMDAFANELDNEGLAMKSALVGIFVVVNASYLMKAARTYAAQRRIVLSIDRGYGKTWPLAGLYAASVQYLSRAPVSSGSTPVPSFPTIREEHNLLANY
ncbi:uncharacterized protein CLUP02_10384 [Colletotrichum lupini]|uniref:GPI inositol-deacylase winged helix domain-containing protein n=1 Tax=Colletotrichum lupini TaxID=145971 RepID=A0A9Q8SX92_9PEZI|nr:uncharacterized protein CLUP02_10384 [Colletotrichum lupini]UQC84888.1 hypothetical protein CLUP02_10384 [Colletotrichum lupini]